MKKHVITFRAVSQGNYESTLVLHGKGVFRFPVGLHVYVLNET